VFAAFSSEGSLHDTIREIPITLILMAGWFGLMTVWTEAVTALMTVWTTDALVEGLAGGLELDVGIASFVRGFVALMLIIFLIVFFIEMLVLSHMLTFGVLIGQVAIAMRPVRPLRGVSGQMIRNMVTLSLVPALGVASLALSLGRLNDAGALSFQRAMGALAGIVVSVLMPLVVAKFLPLGGQTSSAGRSLLGAGAQVAATGAAVAGGGALLAAGGLSRFVTSGGGGGPVGGGGVGLSPASGGGGDSAASASAGLVLAATSSAVSGGSAEATPDGMPRPPAPSSGAGLRRAGSPASSAGGAATTAAVASSVSSLLERGARE
jgi:hypothetical protein